MVIENAGSGWLPVEAHETLEEQQERSSEEAADALIALSPRGRVLGLLRRATAAADVADRLRPVDLRRVLASFAGAEALDADELGRAFPALVPVKSTT